MTKKHEEHFPNVNDNGSLLNPETVTYCHACHDTALEEVKQCPRCGSNNVEVITAHEQENK